MAFNREDVVFVPQGRSSGGGLLGEFEKGAEDIEQGLEDVVKEEVESFTGLFMLKGVTLVTLLILIFGFTAVLLYINDLHEQNEEIENALRTMGVEYKRHADLLIGVQRELSTAYPCDYPTVTIGCYVNEYYLARRRDHGIDLTNETKMLDSLTETMGIDKKKPVKKEHVKAR